MYHDNTLAIAQRELELLDLQDGADRYYTQQELKARFEGFDRRDDVAKMIRGAVPILAESIRGWIEEASAKRGRPSAALAPLKELDADLVALVALSKTFRSVAAGQPLSTTAESIGKGLQVEIEALMVEQKDPKEAKRFLAMAEGEASERTTSKRHEAIADRLGVGLEWSRRTQVLVGGVALNAILTSLAEIFERGMVTDQRGTVPVIKITDEALEKLEDMAAHTAWMQPILRPMIAPPRQWSHYDTGAYLDLRLSKTVPLVRTFNREHRKLVVAAIKDGSMNELLEGVNAIQATRFAIDKRVMEVVAWVREQGHQPAKSFPLSAVPEALKKVPREEWEELTPEARVALARRRKSIRDIRAAAHVDRAGFSGDLAEARRLAEVPCFYLPHSLDFRGRVYAVPHFNPQRSDHIKAMFRFADTAPVGPHGRKWLAIHLANCGDFEKVSKEDFPTRVHWVEQNEAAILQAAKDPQGTYDWWSTADSPFCFLQACFEWAELAASGYSEDFESCIGIALDGSCSGLQHYSAMTRSAEEGYHVNLLPRERPGDIYRVVADKARPTLEALKTRGDLASTIILANGFGRSDVKRNVMTYFYGSGKFGMRDQHMVDTMRPLADRVALGELKEHPYAMMTTRKNKDTGEETEALDGGFTCAQVLAACVYQSVVAVAPKADEAATWFQQVAAILAHESLPVIWRTPVGLPVVQRYSEWISKRINMWLYDRKVHVPTGADKADKDGKVLTRIECLIREAPTKRIDKKKARSAISPNIVHSLDGAHLVRTVVFAAREGITAFQLIHDSFATHAGNTERFFGVIREAFVDLYTNYDPFVELDRYAREVLSEEGREKLPPIPAKGDLDLSAILRSDYAFA